MTGSGKGPWRETRHFGKAFAEAESAGVKGRRRAKQDPADDAPPRACSLACGAPLPHPHCYACNSVEHVLYHCPRFGG